MTPQEFGHMLGWRIKTADEEEQPTPRAEQAQSPGYGPIGRLLHGDEKGLDWRHGLLNPGGWIAAAAGQAALKPINKMVSKLPSDADNRVYQALKDRAHAEGRTVVDAHDKPRTASYVPSRDAIHLSHEMKHPGIMAHELGHANTNKRYVATYFPGMIAGAVGGLATPYIRDEDTSRNVALASSGIQGATVLGNELLASHKGRRMLQQNTPNWHKRPLSYKLSPFVGIPTYAATTAAPLLSHYTKKLLGGFDGREKAPTE